jgi:hypothetical protein
MIARATGSSVRLAELEGQARHARERYDLYRARAYGMRPTSPARMRELERQRDHAESAFRFAQREATQSPG